MGALTIVVLFCDVSSYFEERPINISQIPAHTYYEVVSTLLLLANYYLIHFHLRRFKQLVRLKVTKELSEYFTSLLRNLKSSNY